MNTIFFFSYPAQDHIAISLSPSSSTQDLTDILHSLLLLHFIAHSWINLPQTFHTHTLFNDAITLLSTFAHLGKVSFPVLSLSYKQNILIMAKSCQNNNNIVMSDLCLDQESKATQCLKQPQKHFKCIDAFHNNIMSSNSYLHLNFSLTQMHSLRSIFKMNI